MVGEIHPNQHKDMTQHTDKLSSILLASTVSRICGFRDCGVETLEDNSETLIWVELPNPTNLADITAVSNVMMLHLNEHHNPSEAFTPGERLSNYGVKVETCDGVVSLRLNAGSEASEREMQGGDNVL